MRLWILVLASVLFLPAAAQAGEESQDPRTKALDVLKVRLEAKQREAELLESSGRTEEALKAFREIGEIYDKEIERIAKLFSPRITLIQPPAKRGTPFLQPKRPPSPPPTRLRDPGRKDLKLALAGAVEWLIAHQSPNGGWGAADFMLWCDGKPRMGEVSRRPDGAGKALYDNGVTGLALQALMAAGATPGDGTSEGKAVSHGLRYLMNVQDPEGCFGPRSTQQYVYNHAAGALAMVMACEVVMKHAKGPSLLASWKRSAQRGLDFSALSRNPYFGWRYGIKPGDNDTSVTTWMLSALKRARDINKTQVEAGKAAPFVIDEAAFEGAIAWLNKTTDPDYGKVGYLTRGSGSARPQELLDRFPAELTEAMTSAGLLVRHWVGQRSRTHAVVKKGVNLVLKTLPVWNRGSGQIDMYAWLMGTLAMHEAGGTPWVRWRNAVSKALLSSQNTDGRACDSRGSWDPLGPWGPDGGRVYSTALCTLMLATCEKGL